VGFRASFSPHPTPLPAGEGTLPGEDAGICRRPHAALPGLRGLRQVLHNVVNMLNIVSQFGTATAPVAGSLR
jgi:hypothetical protein